MGKRECSVMIAAHSQARGRVIAWLFFWSELIESGSSEQCLRTEPSAYKRATDADSHSIQKIPACDCATHAQVFFFFLFTHPWSPGKLHGRRVYPPPANFTHFKYSIPRPVT